MSALVKITTKHRLFIITLMEAYCINLGIFWKTRALIFLNAMIISVLMFPGCGPAYRTKCRHNALTAAIVAAEQGHHVRIASGVTSDGRHAQAEALIDDEWLWLCVGPWDVYPCEQDNFVPMQRWTVNDYYVSRFWHLMERME